MFSSASKRIHVNVDKFFEDLLSHLMLRARGSMRLVSRQLPVGHRVVAQACNCPSRECGLCQSFGLPRSPYLNKSSTSICSLLSMWPENQKSLMICIL